MQTMNVARTRSRSTFLLGVAAIAAGAWLLGAQGNAGSAALASSAADDVKVYVQPIAPPVVELPTANSRAIIAASNGAYYVVDHNGVAAPVYAEKNIVLYWKETPLR